MKITRDSKASELAAHGLAVRGLRAAEFVDAQAMHKAHPNTFAVPDEAELAEITPGAHAVKIEAGGERFWVKVQARVGDSMVGSICNDLVFTAEHGLECDDMVEFEMRHIYAIKVL